MSLIGFPEDEIKATLLKIDATVDALNTQLGPTLVSARMTLDALREVVQRVDQIVAGIQQGIGSKDGLA